MSGHLIQAAFAIIATSLVFLVADRKTKWVVRNESAVSVAMMCTIAFGCFLVADQLMRLVVTHLIGI
jgi:hypothetical protein